MKEKAYLSAWRSSEAEQRYRDLDRELWQQTMAAPPPEALNLSTSFGSTRVYRWPGDGPAVMFIHGMCDTSIRWIPYAEQLESHDVYAVDVIGEVGASRPTVGFAAAGDYGDWFSEVAAGLELARPTLVGESLGGYVALSHAMANDVASVVALDPVGVVKLRLARFIGGGLGSLVASISPDAVRRFLGDRLHNPLLHDEATLRLVLHGQRHHPPKPPPIPVFTDEELASIESPVLVLVGAHSSIFDVERLMERIRAIGPTSDARLLPDAGHGFTISHFDDCMAAVREGLAASRRSDDDRTSTASPPSTATSPRGSDQASTGRITSVAIIPAS